MNKSTPPQDDLALIESLRLENAKLTLGMQVAGLALAEVDFRTDLKHLSAEAARIFGLGDAALDVPRARMHEMMHPDDLAELQPLIEASLDPAGDGLLSMDHRIILPGGEVRWLRVREQVFFEGPPGARRPARASMALIDITARKVLEEALHAGEQRIRLATEATGVGIWEWNILTNEVSWDAQMFRIYGLLPTPSGSVSYATWSLAVLPEDLPEQERVLQDTVLRIGQSTRDFRIRRADDGRCRHIQSFEMVRPNASGQAEWVVGTNLDVTERRTVNNRLRASEMRYRRLFEAAHDGVLLLDPATRQITDANPFMTALLGYTHAQLIGKELFEIGLLKDEAASQAMFEKLKAEHQVRYENLPLESQSGQHQDVEVVANLYDEGGHAVIQCNIRDITERRRIEDAQRNTEALFSDLIEQAPVGIYVVDAQFRMRQMNPTALPDFIQVQPLLGRDFADILSVLWPAKIGDPIVAAFRHTLATGDSYQAPDLSGKRKDSGADKVYEWSIQRVTLPNGEYGVVCYYNDITERTLEEQTQRRLAVLTAAHRRLEREIARRQVVQDALTASEATAIQLLEEARIMRDEQRQLSHRLLSAEEEERKRISRELHDVIAQALAGINMRLSLLQSTTNPETLHREIEQTQQLVAQSVDTVHRFARDLRPSMLDHLGLVPALDGYVKEFSRRTCLPVSIHADEGVERLGSTESTVLYRIAQEALTNVDRHAKASSVQITLSQRNGTVCMAIQDDGQGFEVEGSAGSKPNRLGMLGMKERVEMIGGTFQVESAPSSATTIRVSIKLPS